LPVLTISRQPGSLGDEIAAALSSKLGWQIVNRQKILDEFIKPFADNRQYVLLNESSRFYNEKSADGETFLEIATRKLHELSMEQSIIIVGFGARIIFRENPDAVHLRIIAPDNIRIERIRQQFRVSKEEAAQIIKTADKK